MYFIFYNMFCLLEYKKRDIDMCSEGFVLFLKKLRGIK